MVSQIKKMRGKLVHELVGLLADKFSVVELRKLALLHLGPSEATNMPGLGASQASSALELAQALWRCDAINEGLLRELEVQRPRAKPAIDGLRVLRGLEGEKTGIRFQVREHSRCIVLAGSVAVGGIPPGIGFLIDKFSGEVFSRRFVDVVDMDGQLI